jgi:hypothetical protein
MLTKAELNHRRFQVLEALKDLSSSEALAVVGVAMQELSGRNLGGEPRSSAEEIMTRRSRLKVEGDPEVRDFIHSLHGFNSVDQIVETCKERFGSRAPSKSAVYAYFRRLKSRRNLGRL